jgi:hypothetical protein
MAGKLVIVPNVSVNVALPVGRNVLCSQLRRNIDAIDSIGSVVRVVGFWKPVPAASTLAGSQALGIKGISSVLPASNRSQRV